jgi:hypothetical protein
MRVKFSDFKLLLLLAITKTMIRRAGRRSPRVCALMQQENLTFGVLTSSGVGGYFMLRDGQFDLHWGRHEKPDFAQIWRSSADAVRTLTSKDSSALLQAYEDGLYTMQGRFTVALWFNEVLKLARDF